MGKLVTPKVYLVGYTTMERHEMERYLTDSGNEDFLRTIRAARDNGISEGEILCSFFAKICYASLTLGKNINISRTRDIPENLKGCFDQGHLSVFEHCNLNFMIRDCSRVFTHELVRHRAGTAFSQTSGRFVRGEHLDLVFDPILEPVREHVLRVQKFIEETYRDAVAHLGLDDPDRPMDFATRKKLTSALRRMLPNGQSNEIGFSVNLRALRHTVQLRTSRHAEWEIRNVFNQIYELTKERYPLLYHGAREEVVDGLVEVSNMRMQPYERTADGA